MVVGARELERREVLPLDLDEPLRRRRGAIALAVAGADLKDLFASVTEGLDDADLERPREMGRVDQSWDT